MKTSPDIVVDCGPPPLRFIVAELSKNWREGRPVADTPLLCQQFERVIEHNRGRGYRLYSFQLHRVCPTPVEINETLIAVFERGTR